MDVNRFNPARISILAISFSLMCLTPGLSVGQKNVDRQSNLDRQFHFQPSGEGFVRLNKTTGETSFCRLVVDDIVCRLGIEERDALHSEIDELQNTIAKLQGRLDRIGENSPQLQRPKNNVPNPEFSEDGGSERDKIEKEVDRAIDITKLTMRKLFEAVKELQKEFEQGSVD